MRVQGRRVGCRPTDTYAGGPRQNSPLPPRDQAVAAGHGKWSRRREGETVILVCGLSSDHKVSGLPRPSSCDCGCWAIIFDCYGPLISMTSNWRMVFLCLYNRELKAWAYSGLALGAVEVRIRALRTRSHPSTPGPEDGPKGPALVPPPGRMSEGPYCLGRDSYASALAVSETPSLLLPGSFPGQSPQLTPAHHASEAERASPLGCLGTVFQSTSTFPEELKWCTERKGGLGPS